MSGFQVGMMVVRVSCLVDSGNIKLAITKGKEGKASRCKIRARDLLSSP